MFGYTEKFYNITLVARMYMHDYFTLQNCEPLAVTSLCQHQGSGRSPGQTGQGHDQARRRQGGGHQAKEQANSR